VVGIIDLDGVLTHTSEAWLSVLNEQHGTSYTTADIFTWEDITTWFPKKDCYAVLNSEGFYKDLVKPIEGSLEFLTELKELGVTLKLVTANKYSDERHQYIEDNFPDIFSDIHFTDDKTTVLGDFILDDKFENVVNYRNTHNKLGLLYRHFDTYKYNDMRVRSPNFYRVNTYKDVIRIVKSRLC